MQVKLYLRVEKSPTENVWQVREVSCNGILFKCEWRGMVMSYAYRFIAILDEYDVPFDLTIESPTQQVTKP